MKHRLSFTGFMVWAFAAVLAIGGTHLALQGSVLDGVATVITVLIVARFAWWLDCRSVGEA